ncbi:hypothetical protein FP371_24645 [Citrobacter freundii]|uniref:hypothetical protein n=1 Tax=Gammaproteobacteria TaxID=1236 RepID=UPI0005CFC504|nr:MULTISPECIES: hypothetical protein [Gammaproteobacteria]EEA2350762.1 hypothetical protein [Salmonella enterica subsp. enterica serovar Enteritidis]EEC4304687.1 hypothetical protein [Salmonella enterica subsp. enterica serovar Enteritidis]EEN2407385.1 hypothetical protein [Salmonella enterica subsp. enterica serovar Enteritidis]EES8921917.1 hypothetical protein [Escherichia coli]EES9863437.1 hypothetical protein [Escherichia coli]
MKTVYEDVVTKNTKEFAFKVSKLGDGTFLVIQQASRIFPDNRKVIKSEKKTSCTTLAELKSCALKSGRQGKVFLDSQVFMTLVDNKV